MDRSIAMAVLRATNLTTDRVLAGSLESADSLWSKFRGLMGRAELPDDSGLWLPGSNGIHMMFMNFAIDCVFVGHAVGEDGARTVVSVHRAVPAWRGVVWYVRGAHGTLELPVGTIDRTATSVGDRILIGPAQSG